jgi:hypothetical protein
MRRILRFFLAIIKWCLSGFRIRTQREMLKIYKICNQCEDFLPRGGDFVGYDKCNRCGCNLHYKNKVANKIALRSEHCPKGLW